MKVAELMKRDAASCAPQSSLNLAARIMWDNDCGFVPVLDRERKVVGVLTDRDICMAAYTQGLPLQMMTVETAMAKSVVSCMPEDNISLAERLMRDNQVHRLPVVDADGKLCGILSLTDIVQGARRAAIPQTGDLSPEEISRTLGALSQPRSHATAHVAFGPEEGELEFVPSPPAKRGQRHK